MRGAVLLILLAPWDVLSGQTSCPVMSTTNIFIDFRGASSNCNELGGVCMVGENVTFTASSSNYFFSCAPHTFTWQIGGQLRTGQEVTLSFPFPGSYPVTLVLNNGTQTFTTSMNVVVGPLPCGASQSLFLRTEPE